MDFDNGLNTPRAPPPLMPPAPAPHFPVWLDRLLKPLAGPQLSWWSASLRIAFVGQLGASVGMFLLLAALDQVGLPQERASDVLPFVGKDIGTLVFTLMVVAPVVENILMVCVMLLLSAFGLSALTQCLAIFGLAWWGHLAPGESLIAALPNAMIFLVMAWQFRQWAATVGRGIAYLATVASHAAVNGIGVATIAALGSLATQ
jgi:hypothetical protein